ncbi:hypothetical protein BH09MYX1_BH09MYX1_28760 [soil metagenome]
MRKRLAFLPLVACVIGLVGPLSTGACSSGALVPAGGECLQATDCDNGLVCVPQGGKRICSSDITGIVNLPPEAGADATVSDATLDAIIYDAPIDTTPPKDTGGPDVNPPVDSGPPDTGADAGTDSGSQDSGSG